MLSNADFKLSGQKCEFLCKQIRYLLHVIDETGLHMASQKVEEINDLSQPTNV